MVASISMSVARSRMLVVATNNVLILWEVIFVIVEPDSDVKILHKLALI